MPAPLSRPSLSLPHVLGYTQRQIRKISLPASWGPPVCCQAPHTRGMETTPNLLPPQACRALRGLHGLGLGVTCTPHTPPPAPSEAPAAAPCAGHMPPRPAAPHPRLLWGPDRTLPAFSARICQKHGNSLLRGGSGGCTGLRDEGEGQGEHVPPAFALTLETVSSAVWLTTCSVVALKLSTLINHPGI